MKIGTGVQVLPLCHPLAAGRGSGDGRPDQSRKIDLRGRPQPGFPRTYEAYGVPLRRKPRALCRDAGNPEAGVDRGVVLLPGQVLQLRQRQDDAEAVSEAVAGNPDRRQQRRYVPEAIAKLGHPVFVAVRLGTLEELEPEHHRLPRKAWKEAGHPGEGRGLPARPRSMSPKPTEAARDEPEESIMLFLPLPRRAPRRLGEPGRRARGRGPRRARSAPADDLLRGRAAREDHRRLAGAGDRPADWSCARRLASTASSPR